MNGSFTIILELSLYKGLCCMLTPLLLAFAADLLQPLDRLTPCTPFFNKLNYSRSLSRTYPFHYTACVTDFVRIMCEMNAIPGTETRDVFRVSSDPYRLFSVRCKPTLSLHSVCYESITTKWVNNGSLGVTSNCNNVGPRDWTHLFCYNHLSTTIFALVRNSQLISVYQDRASFSGFGNAIVWISE